MNTQTAIRFTNLQIKWLAAWLSKLELVGVDSRARSRFIRLVNPDIEIMERSRIETAERYATKDEQGQPIKTKDTRNVERYQFEPEQLVEFEKEFLRLSSEEYVMDVLESNQITLRKVYDILIGTTDVFVGEDAVLYDEVCTIFEQAHL